MSDDVFKKLPTMNRNPDRDRVIGDPAILTRPSHENRFAQRKGRYDAGWTPTEQRTKDRLMRQFMKNPEGAPNSEAYVSAECWCEKCGRLRDSDDMKCSRCVR